MRHGPDKPKKNNEPFSARAAAELVEVSARTLMHYEKLGLVFPKHKGKIRLFSEQDIKWLRCLRELIHGRNISIAAVKKLLACAPCWAVKNCPRDDYAYCVKSPNKRFTGAIAAPKRACGKRHMNKAQD